MSQSWWLNLLGLGNRNAKKSARRSKNGSTKKLFQALPLRLKKLEERWLPATHIWTGAVDSTWANPNNWSNGQAPAIGETNVTLIFSTASANKTSTDNIAGTLNIDQIQFGDTGYNISVSAGGTVNFTGNAAVSFLDTNATGNNMIGASAGNLTLTGNNTIQVAGSDVIAAAISGSGNVTMQGTGTLSLTANNTYVGTTTILSGTLTTTLAGGLGNATNAVFLGDTSGSNNAALVGAGTATTPQSITVQSGSSGLAFLGGNASATTPTFSGGITLNKSVILVSGHTGDAITGNISGAGGILLAASSGSTMTLAGTNTYLGNTTIASGTLNLNFGIAGAPASNILPSSTTLIMGETGLPINLTANGGSVVVTGAANVTNNQTVAGLVVNVGNSQITASNGTGSGVLNLSLGGITHTTAGLINFVVPTGVGSNITTSTGNTNNILGGWATVGTIGSATQSWAFVDAANSNRIRAYQAGDAGYVVYSNNTALSNTTLYAAGTNLIVSNTTTSNIGCATLQSGNITNINSILVTDTAARTIDIGANATLVLGTYGGIMDVGVNSLTIGTAPGLGNLTAGGPISGTPGEIVLNNSNGTSATTEYITVNSNITDNGPGGSVDVVRSGFNAGGTATGANVTNTFSGGLFIGNGRFTPGCVTGYGGPTGAGNVTVEVGAQADDFTAAGVVINGSFANNFFIAGPGTTENAGFGAIRFSGNGISGNITLQGDARLGADASTGTVSGNISGAANLTVTTGTNPSTLTFSGTNTYTGNTLIDSSLNSHTITLVLGSNTALPSGPGFGNVILVSNGTGSGILDLHGFNATVNGLVVQGTAAGGVVTNLVTGTSTLTVGAGNATTVYTGTITGNGTAVINVVKVGTGTITLSGTNTYVGNTTIQSGALVAGTSVSNATSGAFGNSTQPIFLGDTNGADNNAVALLTAGAVTISRNITLQSAGTGAVTLGGIAAANSTFSGNLTTLTKDLTLTSGFAGAGGCTTFNFGGNDITDGGGGFNVTVTGVGNTLLSGVNAYTGNTTILSGNTLVAGNVAFGTNGPLGNSTNPILLGDSSGINNAGLEIVGNFTVSRDVTIQAGSSGSALLGGTTTGNSTFDGNLTLSKDLTLASAATGANATTFGFIDANGISGPYNVTVTGTGQSLLTTANTYSGSTSILSGTLIAGNSSALGSCTTILLAAPSGTVIAGLLTQGPVTLTQNIIAQAGSTGNVTLGTFDASADTFSGNISLNNHSATLSDAGLGGSSNFTGILSGSNAVSVTGNGSIALLGLNTYTGSTSLIGANATLIANTLTVEGVAGGNASSIGASGTAAANLVFSNGTFDYIGANTTTDHNVTNAPGSNTTINVIDGVNLSMSGNISNTSANTITKTGNGTLSFVGSTNNNFLAANVNAGTLVLAVTGTSSSLAAIGVSLTINNGATVRNAGTGVGQVFTGASVTVNTGGTWDLAGTPDPINALFGGGTVTNSNATSTSLLSVGTSNANSFFTGTLQDGAGQLAFTKVGTGTFNMAGTFGYTGNTTINGGVLSIGNATFAPASSNLTLTNLSGNSTLTNGNATPVALTINTTGTQTFSGTITGGGNISSVTYQGNGSETISGASTYTGNTTILSGTVILGAAASQGANGPLGNSTVPVFIGDAVGSNNAALLTNAAITDSRDISTLGNTTNTGSITLGEAVNTTGSYTGNLTLTRDLTLQAGQTNFETFNFANSGQGLTGPYNVTVASVGTGQVFLGTNNTFTGNLTILAGAFSTGQQFSVGNVTAIFVGDTSGSNNAVLETNFNGLAYTQNITIRSGSSGNASIGTNNAANPTYSGNITLNKDVTLTAITAADGATFNGTFSTGPGALNGVSNVTVSAPANSSTFTVNGVNTYTGNTTILTGTLAISSDTNLGSNATASTLVINGGVLRDTANVTLSGNRTIALGPTSGVGNGTIDVTANQTLTVPGNVTNNGAGTGNLIKTDSGTLILDGTNSYSGNTTVSGGALLFGPGSSVPGPVTGPVNGTIDMNGANLTVINLSGTGTITDSGAAATLTDITSNTQTFSGNLTGSLAFVETGNGTLTLSSANSSYTGNTTLSGGTVIVGANIAFSTNGPLGNNGNPIFVGDPVNGNNTGLLANGAFTVSRDISILGSSGTITLGGTGSVNPTYTGNLLGLNRDLTLTEGGTIANFDTVNFANGITGGGNLTVQGTGQTFLSGNNTFTGNTVVLSGLLATGQQFSVGNSSAIFVGDTQGTNNAALESNFNGVAYTQNITVRSGSLGTATLGVNNVTTGVGNTTTFASNITLNDDVILGGSTNANQGVVFNGVISGSSNVTVTGITSETVTLNGVNTYTGNSTILSGTVLLGGNVTPGAAGPLGNATNTILLGDYTGSANSAALLTNGAFTVGRNILARFGGTGTETLGGASANPSTFSGNVELNHNLVLNQLAGGTANFTGNFSALSGLTIGSTGNGTIQLAGTNTYNGNTTVSNGTLQLVSATALPTTTAVVFSTTAPGTLLSDTSGSDLTVGSLQGGNASTGNISLGSNNLFVGTNNLTGLTYTGNISGSGNLTYFGSGSLTLNGNSTYTGNTTVLNGTLIAGASALANTNGPFGNTSNPIVVGDPTGSNNTSLFNNNTGTIGRNITTQGSTVGAVTLGGITASGAFSGNLTLTRDLTLNEATAGAFEGFDFASGISGPYNVTVTGASTTAQSFLGTNSTYTGNTVVLSGLLVTGVLGAVPSCSTILLGDTSGSNSAALGTNVSGLAFTQNIIVRSGSTGTAILGTNTGSGVTYSSNVTLNKDVILNNSANAISFTGNISGGSNVTVQGTGSTTLSGTSSYTGNTTVLSGTLVAGANSTAGAFGNTTNVILLGDVSGANNAALVVGTGFNIGQNITVRSGSTGTATMGGSAAGSSTISGNITLNKSVTFNTPGTSNITGIISGPFNVTIGAGSGGTVVFAANNTYTGATILGNGALSINTVVNEGSTGGNASPLGASSNAASNLLFTGANSVNLLYTGGNASTDRLFSVASGTQAVPNVSNATTTLTFTNTGALGFNNQTGARSITTATASAGTVVLNMLIADSTATGNPTVVAAHGGTLQLNNSNNSYSGGTVASTAASVTIRAGAANVLGTGALNVTLGTFDLNGFNQSVTNIQGAGGNVTNSCTTAAVLTDAISSTQTYAGVISGNLSLAVAGTGNQTLTGNSTYNGNTTVSGGGTLDLNSTGKLNNSPNVFVSGGGTLLLDNTATNTAGRLPSTANLTLDGGTFQLNGCSTTGNATQTLGTLTLSGGSSSIKVNSFTGANFSNVTFSSLTRNAGATVDFSGSGYTTNDNIKFTNAPVLQNGIIPYATVNGSDFAAEAGNGANVTAYVGYVTSLGASNVTSNVKLTNAGNITLAGNTTINSLIVVGNNGTATIINLQGNTLTIGNGTGQGGVLFAGNSSANFSNGTLAFGTSEGIFDVDNSAANNTVSANITGAACVTYGGNNTAGTLVLSGNNSYSANTFITAGAVSISNDVNLGSNAAASTILLDRGTLMDTANVTLNANRNIALGPNVGVGNGTIDVAAAQTLILSSALTSNPGGSGTDGLVKVDSGNLTLSGVVNTYNGNTTITAGTVKDGVINALPTGTILNVNSAGILDLNGFNQTVAGLVSNGTVTSSGSNTTSVLTLSGAGFTIFSGTLSGNLALVLNGPGVQVLSGATGSYAGLYNGNQTTVNGGTLEFGAANSINSPNVAVFSPGVLDLRGFALTVNEVGGNGTVTNTAGPVALTLNPGGNHSTTANLTGDLGLTYAAQFSTATETLSGVNTYIGNTTINSNGTLLLSSATALPTMTPVVFGVTGNVGSSLALGGFDATVGSLQGGNASTGNISLGSNNLTVGANNLSGLTYSGNISGTGNVTYAGLGSLTLNGASTFTGNTTVLFGTLIAGTNVLGNGNASGFGTSTNPILVGDTNPADANNAALLFSVSAGLSNRTIAVQSGGTGTATIGSSVAMTFNSNITLNKNIVFTETVGTNLLTYNGVISSPGGNFGVTYNSPYANLGVQLGVGDVNTYTGNTSVISGNLFVEGNSSLGNSTTAVLVGDTSGSNAAALWANTGNVSINRNITVQSGSSGVALLGDFNAGPGTFTGNITLNKDVQLNGNATGLNAFFNGTISGNANVTVDGALGTVTLNGNNTYTGNTLILSGTLLAGTNVTSGVAGALGNSTNAILLGDISGANAAALLTNGGFTLSRNITVQSGSTGTASLGGGTASSTTITSNLTLNKNTIFFQATGGNTTVNTLLSGPVSVTIGGSGTGVVTLNANDTYTGNTTISSGTLQVSNFQNGGVASQLGASTNAASNLIINGGTLQYTGGNASTDRLFSIGSSGGTLQSDTTGSGGLIFANTGFMEFNGQTGTRTLNISGNSSTAGTIDAVIGDAGGATTVTKTTDTGTNASLTNWTLSGANTFSGTVNINFTTLTITNSQSLGLGSKTINLNNGTLATNSLHLAAAPGSNITLPSTFTYSTSTPVGFFSDSGNNTIGGTINNTSGGGGTPITVAAGSFLTVTANYLASATGRNVALGGAGNGLWTGTISDGGQNPGVFVLKTGSGTWTITSTNTYSGVTDIFGGVLAVTDLELGGVASSIGSSSNAAANLVLAGGGVLQYIGTGATTDRLLTIGNGTAGASSGGIDASGTGTLNFTNTNAVVYNGNFTSTLTLQGNSTAANAFDLDIGNTGAGNATTLNKNGTGTWVLGANGTTNTYSGGTNVLGGTLAVDTVSGSGTGTGTVSVASNATLAGSGAISGVVTVNVGGTLSPGALGDPSIGNLTIGGGSVINGTLLLETPAYGNASNGFDDQLIVTGNLTLGGSSTLKLDLGNTLSGTGSVLNVVTFTATGLSGTFGSATTINNPNSLTPIVAYNNASGNISLSFTTVAPPTMTVTSSQNPAEFGQTVTFTVTISPPSSPTPTGTVTFTDNGQAIAGGSNITLTAGAGNSAVAMFADSSLPVGNNLILATYSGDGNYTTTTAQVLELVNWDFQFGANFNANGGGGNSPNQTTPIAYTEVVSTPYSSGQGYGWLNTPANYDRGNSTLAPVGNGTPNYQPLLEAFNYGPDNTYEVDLEGGQTYTINVTMGDSNTYHGPVNVLTGGNVTSSGTASLLLGNGTTTSTLFSAGGQFITGSFQVTTTGSFGTLEPVTLEFKAVGAEPNFVINALDVVATQSPITLTATAPSQSGLVTVSGTGATPNSLVSVGASLGTITTTDQEGNFAGTQVVADSHGNFTYTVLESTPGNATFSAQEVDGYSIGSTTETVVPNMHFQFGASFNANGGGGSTSPSQTTPFTYTDVVSTPYSPTLGYGWSVNTPANYDRGNATLGTQVSGAPNFEPLLEAFNYGSDSTFEVQLEGGQSYTFNVTMGDSNTSHGPVDILFNGSNVTSITLGTGATTSSLSSTRGQFTTGSFTEAVGGSGLQTVTLEFKAVNGAPDFVVNALDIIPNQSNVTLTQTGNSTVNGGSIEVVTVTGTGYAPNSLVTISSNAGTVTADFNGTGSNVTDDSPNYAGTQVRSDSHGNITFFVQTLPGMTTGTVSAQDVTGVTVGSGTINFTPVVTYHFEFDNDNDAPGAPGFTGVTKSTIYGSNATPNYGWDNSQQGSNLTFTAPGNNPGGGGFNHGSVNPNNSNNTPANTPNWTANMIADGVSASGANALGSDGVFADTATFDVNVASGQTYHLTFFLGDALQATELRISMNNNGVITNFDPQSDGGLITTGNPSNLVGIGGNGEGGWYTFATTNFTANSSELLITLTGVSASGVAGKFEINGLDVIDPPAAAGTTVSAASSGASAGATQVLVASPASQAALVQTVSVADPVVVPPAALTVSVANPAVVTPAGQTVSIAATAVVTPAGQTLSTGNTASVLAAGQVAGSGSATPALFVATPGSGTSVQAGSGVDLGSLQALAAADRVLLTPSGGTPEQSWQQLDEADRLQLLNEMAGQLTSLPSPQVDGVDANFVPAGTAAAISADEIDQLFNDDWLNG